MKNHSDIKEILFTSAAIQQRVKQLAEEITADFADKQPLFVCILKGAFVFFADLLRHVELDTDTDFVALSSYGNRTRSAGKVNLLKGLTTDCTGRDVIVVEDIVDSGVTMHYLIDQLYQHNAKSVTVAAFLSKPSRRKMSVEIKYLGYEIPDKFVVGYGMDFAEKYRGLQDICVLKEEAYGGDK